MARIRGITVRNEVVDVVELPRCIAAGPHAAGEVTRTRTTINSIQPVGTPRIRTTTVRPRMAEAGVVAVEAR